MITIAATGRSHQINDGLFAVIDHCGPSLINAGRHLPRQTGPGRRVMDVRTSIISDKPQPVPQAEQLAVARRMYELMTRSLLVQAIFVAVRLEIPDLLGDAAMTAKQLAARTGVQPAALHRLLRALTGLEVLTGDGDRFALTPLGQSLRSGPYSVAPGARFLGSPFIWSAWSSLGDAVADGEPAFRHAHDTDLFEYLNDHRDALEAFSRSYE